MEYAVRQVLELACAAHRTLGLYQKECTPVLNAEFNIIDYKFSNKTLMLVAVGAEVNLKQELYYGLGNISPQKLIVIEEDKTFTAEIYSYYRRLMFSVLADPDKSFQQELFSLLSKEFMTDKKFGYIACLPSTYERDRKRTDLSKRTKECVNEYLAAIESKISNVDATVIDCQRSKNFDAFNITAIVENKVVSWFSKTTIDNPVVKIKAAKVKAHQQHWISKKAETRLNYVKVVL